MLPLLGEVTHPMYCRCALCTDVHPTLWLIEAALLTINPSVQARKLMATQSNYTIDDDPFIRVELLLAATLATSYGAKAEQAEHILKDALRAKPLDRNRVDEAVAEANKLLVDVIDADTLAKIDAYVDELISDGARDAAKVDRPVDMEPPEPQHDTIPTSEEERHANLLLLGLLAGSAITRRVIAKGTILEGTPTVSAVHVGMVEAAKYSTNNHFNNIIMPELQQRIDDLFNGTQDQPDVSDVIDFLGRRLKNVPYWRVVANAAASRAYHYGAMKAGEMLGVRAYEIQAVLDERTSDICRHMDGQVFWLHDAVRLLEKAAFASIEESKVLMPWLKGKDIEGMDADELRDLGFMVPPFHGNCRSTIVFIYNN